MENWLLKYPTRRRVMAAALSTCMVFTMLPLQAFAAKPTQNVVSLCEHHPVHTVDCGYTEGTAGTPCTHEHTESCYQEVTVCIHEHTAACYPEDESLSDHDATPSDAENKEPTKCTHICSEDTGCITQEPNCPHDRGEHDDTCGYTKETKGMPCTYICEICNLPQAAAKAPMPTLTAAQNGTDWTIDASGNLIISKQAGMSDWRDNGRSTHESTLKTVTIADAVPEILNGAFLDCHNLTQVTANEAEDIQSEAFKYCVSLTTVSFPKTTYIVDEAFLGCTNLSSACFPAAEDIDNLAFKGCSALATLKLGAVPPVGVKPTSFEGCPATRALTFVDTNGTALTGDALTTAQAAYKAVDDSAMFGEAKDNDTWYGWTIAAAPVDPGWAIDASGNLTISTPAGMTDWVTNGVDTNKSTLKTVTIADAVTEILQAAFYTCTQLKEVTAPGVTDIGESAFEGCKILTSVMANATTSIGKNAFYGCNVLTSASFPKVKTMGAYAFSNCKKLATLLLPAAPPSLKSAYSFANCPATRALTFVDTDGTALTGDALTKAQAAYKAVDDSALSGEAKDNNTWYGWTIAAAPVDPGWVIDASGNLTISTPAGMTDWVKNGSGTNKATLKTVSIADAVTKIPREAFFSSPQLKKVTAHGVTGIDVSSFNSCAVLTSASFPKATTIDNYAFRSCMALSTLELGAVPPPTVGDEVFKYCRTPRALVLVDTDGTALTGDALTKAQAAYKAVDDSAMSGEAKDNGTWYDWTIAAAPADKGWAIDANGSLTISTDAGMKDWVKNGLANHEGTLQTVTIDDAVSEIESGAFKNCGVLTGVTANKVTVIGMSAFKNCVALTTVSLPKADYIDIAVFEGCTALRSADFPVATDMGSYVFEGCTALTSVSVPKVTSIGFAAFRYCKALATLKLGSVPPTTVRDEVFVGCPATRALTFVDANGTALTGDALTKAQTAYKAVDDSAMPGEAKDNGTWYNWTIDAPLPPTVTSVAVTPQTANVQTGTTQQFTADVTGTNSPAQTVTWTVSSGKAGTNISSSGLLTVASDETAATLTVTATSTADTAKSGMATVTVTYQEEPTTVPVIGVTLNKSAISLYSNTVPNTGTLTAAITPSTASNQAVSWSSGNTAVANVANGVVTAVGNGTTTITVTTTDGGKTASCTVNVSTYHSGNDDDGGNGDGDGDGNGSPIASNNPAESVSVSSNATATVDSNGNITASVSDINIADAVRAAQELTSKNGITNGEVTAVINVTAPATGNPDTVAVNLPKMVQEQVINGNIAHLAVVINNPGIAISMNLATITEMNRQANADIQLSATRTDAAKLSAEANHAIGSRPAFDLKATYDGGSKSVTHLGSGTVSVALPYALQSGEAASGLYAAYVDGNGKANDIANSSYDVEKQVLRFGIGRFSVYGIGYKAPIGFTDIANHWAKTDIEFVAHRGLMNSTGGSTFSPDAPISRGMFVTALGKLAGIDTNQYKTGKFTDVKIDADYAPYVNWAADKGILKGIGATTFAPDQAISRQETAVIMSNYARALGYKVPVTRDAVTFADNASIASWAAPAVKQMQMAGILSVKNSNLFDPTGAATRGEISAMLHRYVELLLDKSTSEGWITNDSGSSLYYRNGKALVGTQTLGGVVYTFNSYGETTRSLTTAAANPTLPVHGSSTTHTVKKGDRFWQIAEKYNCDIYELAKINGKTVTSYIYVGEVLKIPQ